jgi:hypothetical protein
MEVPKGQRKWRSIARQEENFEFLFVISEKFLLLYPPSTMTKREPHMAWHAQSLKFVIAREIVSRPYKNPDALMLLRIPATN